MTYSERLEAFPERSNQRIRGRNGRWAGVLDGAIWRVHLADHPHMKDLNSLRATLYGAARNQGLKLRTMAEDDSVVVQAYLPESGPAL